MNPDRDINRIEKILDYCNQIDEANTAFNMSYDEFKVNSIYRNAVCLCLMQIGELTKNLSEEFKDNNPDIPWDKIKGMRNVVAHQYGHIDIEIVWETIEDGVPALQGFCKNKLGTPEEKLDLIL